MFFNASSFPFTSENSPAPDSIPSRTSKPKIAGQSCFAMPVPVMRSRSAGATNAEVCPDFAGMRRRRAQADMHLNALQRSRGIGAQRSMHEEILEAYGYGQLAQLVFDAPAFAVKSLHAMSTLLGNALDFRVGPPSAAAAPLKPDSLSVDDFIRKFSADFEISLNAPARELTDMRGMVILIGEHHYDPAIQRLVRASVNGFDRERGDRLFVEGWQDKNCDDRVDQYGMEPEDCHVLEKNSEAFAKLIKWKREYEQVLERCVTFLGKYVSLATEKLPELNLESMIAFIDQQASKLPASRVATFRELRKQVRVVEESMNHDLARQKPAREAWMADVVRKGRTAQGLNYVIVGADHVAGIRDSLKDLPVLRAIPRTLFARFPKLKQEL